MNNLEHYSDLGYASFTELGLKPGKLKGCHLARNGNLCGIYLGLNIFIVSIIWTKMYKYETHFYKIHIGKKEPELCPWKTISENSTIFCIKRRAVKPQKV